MLGNPVVSAIGGEEASPPDELYDARLAKIITRLDAVARRLSTMIQLESLDINFGKITDLGLQELRSLKALTYLDIRKCPVTAASIAEFQELLPMCKVISE